MHLFMQLRGLQDFGFGQYVEVDDPGVDFLHFGLNLDADQVTQLLKEYPDERFNIGVKKDLVKYE